MRTLPSIRARLLAGLLVSLAVILGVASWASYEVSRHEAEEILSARLATSARVLDALVAPSLDHATVSHPIIIALPSELALGGEAGSRYGHPYETKIAFLVWRGDGTLVARSESAPPLPFDMGTPGFSRRRFAGEDWQIFELRSRNARIQVAEKTEVRDEIVHDLGLAVMMPLLAGAVLLLVVANLVVRYGLKPLSALAAGIGRREPTALDRIEVHAVPYELAPVVQALNDLLERVRLAFERERRFTDAAAHELRTPLAALKLHAENAMRAQTDADRDRSLGRLMQGLERTIRLAEQMLAYSRSQVDADREERVHLVLAGIVAETIAATEPLRRARGQGLTFMAGEQASRALVLGEPARLQRLVRNLLDNAARFAPPASTLDVSLLPEGGRLVLRVGNPGPVVPGDLRERVFEPYFRVPGTGEEGSGLGLAIVRQIADQHAASVVLGSRDDGSGTVVTVDFPLADGDAPSVRAAARPADRPQEAEPAA